MLKGNIVGLVRLYTSDEYNFSSDDISFVNMAASFGASSLENTGYFRTSRKSLIPLKDLNVRCVPSWISRIALNLMLSSMLKKDQRFPSVDRLKILPEFW